MGGPPQLRQRHWNVGNAPRPKPNHGHADKQLLRRRFHQGPGATAGLPTGALPVGRVLEPVLPLAVPRGPLQKQPMHVTARCGAQPGAKQRSHETSVAVARTPERKPAAMGVPTGGEALTLGFGPGGPLHLGG